MKSKEKSMKVKAIIEEVISKEFEVEVSSLENAYDEIRKMYKDGKLILEDPCLTEANLMVVEEDGSDGGWNNLHV